MIVNHKATLEISKSLDKNEQAIQMESRLKYEKLSLPIDSLCCVPDILSYSQLCVAVNFWLELRVKVNGVISKLSWTDIAEEVCNFFI